MNEPRITLSPIEKATLDAVHGWCTLEEVQRQLHDFYGADRVRSTIAGLRRAQLLTSWAPENNSLRVIAYKQSEIGEVVLRLQRRREEREIAQQNLFPGRPRRLRLVGRR